LAPVTHSEEDRAYRRHLAAQHWKYREYHRQHHRAALLELAPQSSGPRLAKPEESSAFQARWTSAGSEVQGYFADSLRDRAVI